MKSYEAKEQVAYFEWLFHQKIDYHDVWHTPNEGARNPRTGAYLKKMGLKRGIPDVIVAIPIPPYHGLFIEFKAPSRKNKLTPDQKKCLNRQHEKGYAVAVCYNCTEAIAVTERYLNANYEMAIDNLENH